MSLSSLQITRLVETIHAQWTPAKLVEFARDEFDISVQNLAPQGSLKEQALKFLEEINKFPAKDGLLLARLKREGNPAIKALAEELLNPSFFPPGDPFGAIVVGGAPFVGRGGLRQAMLEFTMPQGAAHTIFIQGPVPCGKSYSWYFVRHLAQIAGANALPLKLKGTDYKPRQFFEQIFRLLDLDPTKLPPMADDPQLARIDAPMNAFRGAVSKLQQPTWLVIDDLNEQDVKPSIREAAYEVAAAVEEMRPPNLWVILIGYPDSIAADDRVALSGREEPQFPDVELVAHHLEELSKLSQRPITSARAEELSQILFSRIANPDKVSMSDLTRRLRPLGDMLRSGTEVKIE